MKPKYKFHSRGLHCRRIDEVTGRVAKAKVRGQTSARKVGSGCMGFGFVLVLSEGKV